MANFSKEELELLRPWCMRALEGEIGVEVLACPDVDTRSDESFVVRCSLKGLCQSRIDALIARIEELKSKRPSFIRHPLIYGYLDGFEWYGTSVRIELSMMRNTQRASVKDCAWPLPGERVCDFPTDDPLYAALAPERERKEVVEEAWTRVVREFERRGRIGDATAIFCAPAIHGSRKLEREMDEVMGELPRYAFALPQFPGEEQISSAIAGAARSIRETCARIQSSLDAALKKPTAVEERERMAQDVSGALRFLNAASSGVDISFEDLMQTAKERSKDTSFGREEAEEALSLLDAPMRPHPWSDSSDSDVPDSGEHTPPTLGESADLAYSILGGFGFGVEKVMGLPPLDFPDLDRELLLARIRRSSELRPPSMLMDEDEVILVFEVLEAQTQREERDDVCQTKPREETCARTLAPACLQPEGGAGDRAARDDGGDEAPAKASSQGGGLKQREGDQPLPHAGSEDATRVMLAMMRHLWEGSLESALTFVEDRVQVGIERYGQTLHTFDGRDAIRDLDEELADAITYMVKAILEGHEIPARTIALHTTLRALFDRWTKDPDMAVSYLRALQGE